MLVQTPFWSSSQLAFCSEAAVVEKSSLTSWTTRLGGRRMLRLVGSGMVAVGEGLGDKEDARGESFLADAITRAATVWVGFVEDADVVVVGVVVVWSALQAFRI